MTAPFSWWLATMTIAGFTAASIHGGYGGLRAWVPYVVAFPVAAVLMLALGQTTVDVVGGELRVRDGHIPLGQLGVVRVLSPTETRRAVRRQDPLAFVVVRGWLRQAVQVDVVDPEDDTPYWLVSSRHPERLAVALSNG